MATRYWTGASADGNLSTAGNWDGAATVPAAGDTAYIDSRGSVGNITSGTTNDLVALYITEGFAYNIGTAATPVAVVVAGNGGTGTLRVAGGGSLYALSGNVGVLEVKLRGGQTYSHTSGTVGSDGPIVLAGGTATLGSGCTLSGVIHATNGCSASVEATFATCVVDGATLSVSANISGTAIMHSGVLHITGTTTINTAYIGGGTLKDHSSGTLGTATTPIVIGSKGTYTVVGTPWAAKTISYLVRNNGSTVVLADGAMNVTVTSTQFIGPGGGV